MGLFSIFKRKQKPVVVPSKQREFSCVAKTILADLTENGKILLWGRVLPHSDGDFGVSYDCEYLEFNKKYRIRIGVSCAYLLGLHYPFTKEESLAISAAGYKLIKRIDDEIKQAQNKEELEKLKKVFPNCFK